MVQVSRIGGIVLLPLSCHWLRTNCHKQKPCTLCAFCRFPGPIRDILPIAGFQWYDDRCVWFPNQLVPGFTVCTECNLSLFSSARTIIVDTVFEGYKFLEGYFRQSVFLSMIHSDEFKPSVGLNYFPVPYYNSFFVPYLQVLTKNMSREFRHRGISHMSM